MFPLTHNRYCMYLYQTHFMEVKPSLRYSLIYRFAFWLVTCLFTWGWGNDISHITCIVAICTVFICLVSSAYVTRTEEIVTNCRIYIIRYRGGSRGGGAGGPGPPLSENLGIDFNSGFRIFFHVYTFIVASEKKTQGRGAIRNPKKSRYRLL